MIADKEAEEIKIILLLREEAKKQGKTIKEIIQAIIGKPIPSEEGK